MVSVSDISRRLTFPLTCIGRDAILVKRDSSRLFEGSTFSIRRGWFHELEIFDSSGCYLVLRNGVPNRKLTLWDYLLNRPVSIAAFEEVENIGHIELIAFKDRLEEMIEVFSEFYSAGGDIDELKRSVHAAASYEEAMAHFE